MPYTTPVAAPVFGLRREVERLLDDVTRHGQTGRGSWSPMADVRETDDALIFAVEIPGLKLADVEVTAENDILTIRGQRSEALKEGEDGHYHRYHLVERSYGSFTRRFQLPPGVDNARIEATVDQGMLEVRIPKAALRQPTRVHIKTAAPMANGAPHVAGPTERPAEMPKTK